VNLRADSSIRLLLDNEFPLESFVRTITVHETSLYAPVEAGQILGEITITLDGVEKGTVPLIANTSIELNRIEHIRMQVIDAMSTRAARIFIGILLALILGYVALVIRYNVVRHKRLRTTQEAKNKLIEERKKNSHRY
jgi:D-alanyl-D-alanine carboxypeptidase (penicillin-binding protein 5/6)